MIFEPIFIHHLFELYQNPHLNKILLCQNDEQAEHFYSIFLALSKNFLTENEILFLPGFLQTGVYKYESAKKSIAKRLHLAHILLKNNPRIILTSVNGYLRRFPNLNWIETNSLFLKTNQSYDIDYLLEQFNQKVYTEVNRVENVGEFAVRGSILDFWTPGQNHPVRVEFFEDIIKQIKLFRSYDQKSFQNINEIYILPSREFVWPDKEKLIQKCEQFNTQILKQKVDGINRSNLLEDLKSSIPFPGIDDLSYMFDEPFYSFSQEYQNLYSKKTKYKTDVVYLSSKNELSDSLNNLHNLYDSESRNSENKNIITPKFETLFPDAIKFKNILNTTDDSLFILEENQFSLPKNLLEKIADFSKESLESKSKTLKELYNNKDINQFILCAKSKDSAIEIFGLFEKYLSNLLKKELNSIKFFAFDDLVTKKNDTKFNSDHAPITANILNIDGLFFSPDTKTLYISENIIRNKTIYELFHEENSEDEAKLNSVKASQIFLASQFSEFSEGDLVVHVQHGISRFKGLATVRVGSVSNDFLVLEFADNDKVYVPVNKLNFVQKYIGASSTVQLDSLKTKAWIKRKEKIKKDVEQLAQKLLEHHAKQAITPGTAFSKIGEDYVAFVDAFPYEDTPDQHRATQEIMKDMSMPKAMDRLLCGDVGFGKTEVAMRACYRAVLDGKQVAWLVPTTVLAHQHYRTLLERFSPFGVRVKLLDRATGATNETLNQIQKGNIDILIGTHRILSKDIKFRDLGLLVVDEEQHFGVMQKEKIKTMSYGIDVLTLTATPIPRTLQMALIGIRDLSLLTTPPKSRLATKTFVCPFEDKTILDAINFEISRGGQIFYVHNRVEELQGVKNYLSNLLPKVRIVIGHGKMPQNDLEKTVLDFLDRKYDLFLCTTIVEAGIDMPNVNTILVQNANNLGLAQLYQLRGRVGRRATRGYAYFLVNKETFEKDTGGMKRLDVLKDHQELGSGFIIASHDLEMRGSGDILGDEQSGKVREIGLETYLQMLDDAIKQLGGVKAERKTEVDLQIPLSLQIPESYIESARDRLLMYRKFFGARSEEVLRTLQSECEDRFGPMPTEVLDLIEISRIRRLLLTIGAISFTVGENLSECKLDQQILQSNDEHTDAFIKRVLDLCNRKSKNIRMTQDGRLLFPLTKGQFLSNKSGSLDEIKKMLNLLVGS